MLKSMTGYGRGRAEGASLLCQVEMYSVNHRYCDVSVRGGLEPGTVDPRVKKLVREGVRRGRVSVTLLQEPLEGTRAVEIDMELARGYKQALERMKKELGLGGDVGLDLVARLPQVVKLGESAREEEQWWPVLERAVNEALAQLVAARQEEGHRLEKDIRSRIEMVREAVAGIRELARAMREALAQHYRERVEDLLPSRQAEPGKLRVEAAGAAERADIAEELTRLDSHLAGLERLLGEDGPAGREMEFTLQEMMREVNTIAAKSSDGRVSQLAIGAKTELERIREQTQNVE